MGGRARRRFLTQSELVGDWLEPALLASLAKCRDDCSHAQHLGVAPDWAGIEGHEGHRLPGLLQPIGQLARRLEQHDRGRRVRAISSGQGRLFRRVSGNGPMTVRKQNGCRPDRRVSLVVARIGND
jgi:hypothetical protein